MNNNQQQPTQERIKNVEDFNKYFTMTITINKYIDRLLEKVSKEKAMNKSQCIRHLIYNEYQKIKNENKLPF